MIDSWKFSAFLTLGLLVVVLAESSVDDRHHQHHNHHHLVVNAGDDGAKSLGDDLTSPDVDFDTKVILLLFIVGFLYTCVSEFLCIVKIRLLLYWYVFKFTRGQYLSLIF